MQVHCRLAGTAPQVAWHPGTSIDAGGSRIHVVGMATHVLRKWALLINGRVVWEWDGDLQNPLGLVRGSRTFTTNDELTLALSFALDHPGPESSRIHSSFRFDEEPDFRERPASIFWQFVLAHSVPGNGFLCSGVEGGEVGLETGNVQISITPQGMGIGRPRGSAEPGPILLFDYSWSFDKGNIRRALVGQQAPVTAHAITSDEVDCLRQEYIDLDAEVIPDREEIVPIESAFNKGNYSVGLNAGMQEKFSKVLAGYRGHVVLHEPIPDMKGLRNLNTSLLAEPFIHEGEPVFIPNDALLIVKSGYRCPRRNVGVAHSLFPITSKHVWGRALDLAPRTTLGVTPSGKKVPLIVHSHLYPTLLSAARAISTAAIGEHGTKPVPIGDASEDHVHLQW